jgi:hypothetical protein
MGQTTRENRLALLIAVPLALGLAAVHIWLSESPHAWAGVALTIFWCLIILSSTVIYFLFIHQWTREMDMSTWGDQSQSLPDDAAEANVDAGDSSGAQHHGTVAERSHLRQ